MTRPEAERIAWIVGAVGIIGCAVAWLLAPGVFPHAWLAAVTCWSGWPLGSLALLLIHALTGGRWGWTIRPQLVAGVTSLPLVVPFAIPLALLLRTLYPWARPDVQPGLHNGFYLNPPFFFGRGIFYMIVWLALGGAALWSLRRPDPQATLRRLAPPALILLALTVTFAAIDATMSLDPDFKSSIYGMLVGTEAVLFALSIAVLAVTLARPDTPSTRDLGKLLLALVILWAYLDFMQVLIIWQSDLPDEAAWYLPRITGFWLFAAIAIAVLHFALPFFALLWPQVQRSRPGLMAIAGALVAAEIVRGWWLVIPAAGRGIGLTDPLAMLAVFGLGAGLALRATPILARIAATSRHV